MNKNECEFIPRSRVCDFMPSIDQALPSIAKYWPCIAKHLPSIYEKLTKHYKFFNQVYGQVLQVLDQVFITPSDISFHVYEVKFIFNLLFLYFRLESKMFDHAKHIARLWISSFTRDQKVKK